MSLQDVIMIINTPNLILDSRTSKRLTKAIETMAPIVGDVADRAVRVWTVMYVHGVDRQMTGWINTVLKSNSSYKRDDVDGFGQIQPCYIAHL